MENIMPIISLCKEKTIVAKYIKDNLKEAYWIATYDDCDLIRKLHSEFDLQEYTLTHMAGKTKVGKELLIKNFNIK